MFIPTNNVSQQSTLLFIFHISLSPILKKNASENVVCLSYLLHTCKRLLQGLFWHTDKQCGPISEEQSDLGPHYLVQRHFKRSSRQHTADDIVIGEMSKFPKS